MAITERIEMSPMSAKNALSTFDSDAFLPGLRVMARTTSSSFSDYPEWNLTDQPTPHLSVVTDGACS